MAVPAEEVEVAGVEEAVAGTLDAELVVWARSAAAVGIADVEVGTAVADRIEVASPVAGRALAVVVEVVAAVEEEVVEAGLVAREK